MKKLMTFSLLIVFLIAVIIGAGVILSVRNVNVTYIDYSGLYEDEYNKTRENLDKLKGSGLLFVSDDDVAGKISDRELFKVKSYEKKFPCSIDIVIEERIECFCLKTDKGYSVYDTNGEHIKTTTIENSMFNSVDGCPNVLLEVSADQIKEVAKICSFFNDNFGSLRRLVSKIYTIEYSDLLTFKLRSGLTITLTYWNTLGEQKIKKAYEKYATLSDGQKTTGSIIVDEKENLGPIAQYLA